MLLLDVWDYFMILQIPINYGSVVIVLLVFEMDILVGYV